MASELERLCEILAKLDADLTEVAAGLVGCAQHMDRGIYKVQAAHNMDPLSGQVLVDAGLSLQAAQATCTEAAVVLDATSKAGQKYINYLLGSGRQFGTPTSGPAASSQPTTSGDSQLVQGAARVPSAWGDGIPINKGVGTKWFDPVDQGNGIRIDQGNPAHRYPSQQVDHVIVRSRGNILGPDGRPIVGPLKNNPQAHIPVADWLNWREWDRP